LKGHLIETLIKEPREGEYMKFDEGIYQFNLELNKHFSFLKKFDKPPTPKENMKLLKTKYKSLFSGETLIVPEKLLKNEKNVILLASMVENFEAYMKVCNHVFWNLLMKMPYADIINIVSERVPSAQKVETFDKNSSPTKTKEEVKDAVEKLRAKLETSGIVSFLSKFQSILAHIKEPENAYRKLPEESGGLGIVKFFYWFNQIYELTQRCMMSLKQELHFRAFVHLIRPETRARLTMENNPIELSGQNFTSLYRDIFAMYDTLKNSLSSDKLTMIFGNYLTIVAKIIKRSFLRSEKISRPYIKTYLQNISSLKAHLKKLDLMKDILTKKDNPLASSKNFFELFLFDEKELLEFARKNRNKVKSKHIDLYIKLKSQASEIKVDQKQEMERMNALSQLTELARELRESEQPQKQPATTTTTTTTINK